MDRNHECTKDEAFQEVSKNLADVGKQVGKMAMEIALVKKDTGDLKEVTKEMATCIAELTKSSIKTGENLITRDQFYGKIEEMQKSYVIEHTEFCNKCVERHTALEKRLDARAEEISKMKTTVDGHESQFKWQWGILAAIIVAFALLVINHMVTGV